MNKLDKKNLRIIEEKFQLIQKKIDSKLKKLNKKPAQRIVENWKRSQGGGGKSISISGDIIEKAAVNFSSISGKKLPQSSLASKATHTSKFHAVGVSVISHPLNPFCPTSHMNIRLFVELGKNNLISNWWIGGGFDLTPFAASKKDASFWHQEAKSTMGLFNKTYYKRIC